MELKNMTLNHYCDLISWRAGEDLSKFTLGREHLAELAIRLDGLGIKQIDDVAVNAICNLTVSSSVSDDVVNATFSYNNKPVLKSKFEFNHNRYYFRRVNGDTN